LLLGRVGAAFAAFPCRSCLSYFTLYYKKQIKTLKFAAGLKAHGRVFLTVRADETVKSDSRDHVVKKIGKMAAES
jgi:hypothetical protein